VSDYDLLHLTYPSGARPGTAPSDARKGAWKEPSMDAATLRSLELAKESSDRARSVLLFMQVACIIVFMAAWHEAPFSWTYSRLRLVQAAAWYYNCAEKRHPEEGAPSPESIHENCHFIPGAQPFSDAEIREGEEFVRNWKFTPAQTTRQLQELQDSLVRNTMNVTVPLLGFTFDLNDLGLIGGLSLFFLLAWLYFSLRREEGNVRILFDSQTGSDAAEIYRLACMTQVLTIPPEQHDRKVTEPHVVPRKVSRLILRGTLRLLFVTPVGVQGFVLWLDRSTWTKGTLINEDFVRQEFLCGCVLLGLLAILTLLCWRRASATNKRWEIAHLKH
jgi:hypothetical protein